jgi:hypothetical protein
VTQRGVAQHKEDVAWHKEDVKWHKEVWCGTKRMRGEVSQVSGESVIEIKNTVKGHLEHEEAIM